jgi:hypothetical protein
MTQQHPITPPPELVEQWEDKYSLHMTEWVLRHVAAEAAQWGADQELEACCEWLQDPDLNVDTYKLRTARRPKPPSLKEQALQALNDAIKMADDAPPGGICSDQANIIRRALEALPE